jgi:hypothetical protein
LSEYHKQTTPCLDAFSEAFEDFKKEKTRSVNPPIISDAMHEQVSYVKSHPNTIPDIVDSICGPDDTSSALSIPLIFLGSVLGTAASILIVPFILFFSRFIGVFALVALVALWNFPAGAAIHVGILAAIVFKCRRPQLIGRTIALGYLVVNAILGFFLLPVYPGGKDLSPLAWILGGAILVIGFARVMFVFSDSIQKIEAKRFCNQCKRELSIKIWPILQVHNVDSVIMDLTSWDLPGLRELLSTSNETPDSKGKQASLAVMVCPSKHMYCVEVLILPETSDKKQQVRPEVVFSINVGPEHIGSLLYTMWLPAAQKKPKASKTTESKKDFHLLLEGDGISNQKPTDSDIADALTKLITGQNSFVVLSRDELTYIQACPDIEGLTLEYQVGDVEHHYKSSDSVPLDQAISIFWLYAQDDSTWKNETQWEHMKVKPA